MSNHWLMNTSFAYNSTDRELRRRSPAGEPASGTTGTIPFSEDPTNRGVRDGCQYDYLTAGSGIGNVYVNAKWLFKLSGMYQLPFDVNVSAFYNARQGYPFEQRRSRARRRAQRRRHGVHRARSTIGEKRLPNFQNVDFHVERPVKHRHDPVRPVAGRVQRDRTRTRSRRFAARRTPSNANHIQAIVAPRVVRFGVRVNW